MGKRPKHSFKRKYDFKDMRYARIHNHSCTSTRSRMSVTSCPPNAWQCLAYSMAMPLAIVRSCGEQAVSIMGQTSRCCMVCLMPHPQFFCSLKNPHFNMFTLDRPTCVLNRLRAFQFVEGLSAPAGRCSSALILRCTLAPRGSSRFLHNSMRAAFTAYYLNNREAKRELDVFVDNKRLVFQQAPKYLGVRLDRMLNFKQHLEEVAGKVTSRGSLIRRLAGTTY